MTLFNANGDNVLLPPHVKHDGQGTHMEEPLGLETDQLMIRSPEDGYERHTEQPYKKLRYDPWSVDYLCCDPSSPLVNMPLESIFEYSTFQLLSPEEQAQLARLLPTVDTTFNTQGVTVPPSFFSKTENPIFWNALDDWQTMLANGDFVSTGMDQSLMNNTTMQQQPQPPVSSGWTRGDAFKDEAFEAYWGELNDKDKMHNVAGDSRNITLKDMCRKGLIRERDVIVYKRNFSACKVVVSKTMTVVKASGSTGISIELDNQIFEDFETPTALETKILDQHGKVSKDKRPNGNAFKSIRLLRNGKDLGRLFDIRKDGFGDAN